MPWPKISTTHYNAQLRLPYKGRAIKGTVVLKSSDLLKISDFKLLSTVLRDMKLYLTDRHTETNILLLLYNDYQES